jgi:hypothetical protein
MNLRHRASCFCLLSPTVFASLSDFISKPQQLAATKALEFQDLKLSATPTTLAVKCEATLTLPNDFPGRKQNQELQRSLRTLDVQKHGVYHERVTVPQSPHRSPRTLSA